MKQVSPSVRETVFNCPHCGVLANQFWHTLCTIKNEGENQLPFVVRPEYLSKHNFNNIADLKVREETKQLTKRLAEGHTFLEKDKYLLQVNLRLYNTFVSECFNCNKLSVWIYDRLVYPQRGEAPPANPDLSEDIRCDYNEASSILDLSPRGSAALIRLAIQKLCEELGETGESLNKDIGALVAKGLNPQIQKALDVVRVIGNNAVHPGQIDFRDDRATAESLFSLLNLIAEKMISGPKHVEEVYASLPEGARKAIEERDGKN